MGFLSIQSMQFFKLILQVNEKYTLSIYRLYKSNLLSPSCEMKNSWQNLTVANYYPDMLESIHKNVENTVQNLNRPKNYTILLCMKPHMHSQNYLCLLPPVLATTSTTEDCPIWDTNFFKFKYNLYRNMYLILADGFCDISHMQHIQSSNNSLPF